MYINKYLYRGYRYESELKLYYLNSRFYNPVIGRFINADGLIPYSGGVSLNNTYNYSSNNPIMNIDKSGLMSKGWKLAFIGLAAVGVVAVVLFTFGAAAPLAGVAIGAASAMAQVYSNVSNEQPILKNTMGAFLGGMISGMTGGIGQIAAGYFNATINEIENEVFWDNDNEDFSWDAVKYEGRNYTVSNFTSKALTGLAPCIGFTSQKGGEFVLSLYIDMVAYTGSDKNKERVLKWGWN